VKNEEVLQSRRRGISYIQQKEARLTELVTSGVGTCLLTSITDGRI
jgi:hypothetical protein